MRKMVMMYLLKSRLHHKAAVEATLRDNVAVTSDIVAFDASRVACREVLAIQSHSNGVFSALPLQVLPDQTATLDVSQAVANLSKAVQKQGTRGKSLKKPAGMATKVLCCAVVSAMFQVFPYENARVWVPLCRDLPRPRTLRAWDDNVRQFYNWDARTGQSTWVLDPALWEVGKGAVRSLVFLADEGSTGYSLWWWLVYCGLRCMFFRDPPHRISNLYVHSMRGVKQGIQAAMDVLLVHKYRRAPYGSGRFWREAKETIALVQKLGLRHPIIHDFAPAIARDHGLSVDEALHDNKVMTRLLQSFSASGAGQRVETRRWWTKWDADLHLDKMWHTLLAALIMQFYIAGVDPWVIAKRSSVDTPDRDDDDSRKEFCFKQTVLTILMSSFNQNMLRSQLETFRRIRTHHKEFIEHHLKPGRTLRFHVLWSDLQETGFKSQCWPTRVLARSTCVFAVALRACIPASSSRNDAQAS